MVFAHQHENAKSIQIRYRPLPGVGCMVDDIIVVENLYFRPCTQKRYSNVFKNLHSMGGSQKPVFLTPKNSVHAWTEGY